MINAAPAAPELTENALIDNSNKTVALLGDLRRLGVQVIMTASAPAARRCPTCATCRWAA